jgi:hypothetical protein
VKQKIPTFDPEHVRDISEKVYRIRLNDDCPSNVDRMLAKDDDGGKKLRNRARSYDALTRAYLKALEIKP